MFLNVFFLCLLPVENLLCKTELTSGKKVFKATSTGDSEANAKITDIDGRCHQITADISVPFCAIDRSDVFYCLFMRISTASGNIQQVTAVE